MSGHDVVPCYACPVMVRMDAIGPHLQRCHGHGGRGRSEDNNVPANPLSSQVRYSPPLFNTHLRDGNSSGGANMLNVNESIPVGLSASTRGDDGNNSSIPFSMTLTISGAGYNDDSNGSTIDMLLRNILDGDSSYEHNLNLMEQMGHSHVVGIENPDAVSSLLSEDEANVVLRNGGVCPVCQCSWQDVHIPNVGLLRKSLCGHVFCDSCLRSWFRVSNKCPVCRVNLPEVAQERENAASRPATTPPHNA